MRCRKITYPSEQAAMTAKRGLDLKRGILLRAYQCSKCRKWHLGNTKGTRMANLDRAFQRMHEREGRA